MNENQIKLKVMMDSMSPKEMRIEVEKDLPLKVEFIQAGMAVTVNRIKEMSEKIEQLQDDIRKLTNLIADS